MRLRIYIAGPYAKRKELREVAEKIIAAGHTVTSQWLWLKDHEVESKDTALNDLMHINDSTVFLAMTEPKGSEYSTGGRHFEAGWAYSRYVNRRLSSLCMIGPLENTFYHLKEWQRFYNVDDFLAKIGAK